MSASPSAYGNRWQEVPGRTGCEPGLLVEPRDREAVVRASPGEGSRSPRPAPMRRMDAEAGLFSASAPPQDDGLPVVA